MYSQPWAPIPSTTASAPELRTANPSPARPEFGHLADHPVLEGRCRLAFDHTCRRRGRRAPRDARLPGRRPDDGPQIERGAGVRPQVAPGLADDLREGCRPDLGEHEP